MSTYYRNLRRHLTGGEESCLDAIVARATGNPQAGIGYPLRHESPRVWLEDCAAETAKALDHALTQMGLWPRKED